METKDPAGSHWFDEHPELQYEFFVETVFPAPHSISVERAGNQTIRACSEGDCDADTHADCINRLSIHGDLKTDERPSSRKRDKNSK